MCCGKKWNPNEPLGMPPGSNRTILSYIIVGPFVATCISIIYIILFLFPAQTAIFQASFLALTNAATMVITFYFHQRTTDNATKEIVNAHNNVLEARDREIELLNSVNRSRGLQRRSAKSKNKSEETPLIPAEEMV